MGFDTKGNIDWFAFYYDPIEKSMCTLRDEIGAYAAIAITLYVLPRSRELGIKLYEMAVNKLGWNAPEKALLQLHPDPRWLTLGIITAREVGDSATEARLRQVAEADFEPKFFGPDGDHFGWWFGFGEDWPRGQLSSLMVLSELGEPGAWSRVFNEPNLEKFSEPTVSGVDYPNIGLAQCWNDLDAGELRVETYCATASARGKETGFTVNGLPDPGSVRVMMDGHAFNGWSVSGPDSIEIRTQITTHEFCISTGFNKAVRASTPMSTIATSATSERPVVTVGASVLATAQRVAASGGCSSGCC